MDTDAMQRLSHQIARLLKCVNHFLAAGDAVKFSRCWVLIQRLGAEGVGESMFEFGRVAQRHKDRLELFAGKN